MYFSMKQSKLLTFFIWGYVALLITAYTFGKEPMGNQFIPATHPLGILFSILSVIFLLSLLLRSGYTLTDETLTIHRGLMKQKIPLDALTDWTADEEKLTIHCGTYDTLVLMPKEMERFLETLHNVKTLPTAN